MALAPQAGFPLISTSCVSSDVGSTPWSEARRRRRLAFISPEVSMDHSHQPQGLLIAENAG
ncbi:MAG: hypothetical protein WAM11_11740 [Cyanobium sp.]